MENNEKKLCTDWCFTWNFGTEQMLIAGWRQITDAVENSGKFSYVRMQVEKGESGNLHIQGFAIMKSRSRWATINRWIGVGGAHWEVRKGSREEADQYCRKTDTRVLNLECNPTFRTEYEFGELPKPRKIGRPSSKEAILEDIREEIDMTGEMPEQSKIPASILFDQVYDRILVYASNSKSYVETTLQMRKTLVLHGAAGIGKSFTAAKVAEEIFGIAGVLKLTVTDRARLWFPPNVIKPKARVLILDEFHWGSIAADQFKALLSGDAPILDVKGGYRTNNFVQIIITTNDNPRKWGVPARRSADGNWIADETDPALVYNDNYQAVQRRFVSLDCSQLGEEGEARRMMEVWLRDHLSWGLTQHEAAAAEVRRRIGEGAASQRLGCLDGIESDDDDRVWTPRTPEIEDGEDAPSDVDDEGRLRRSDATLRLLGSPEVATDDEESRMTDEEDEDDGQRKG